MFEKGVVSAARLGELCLSERGVKRARREAESLLRKMRVKGLCVLSLEWAGPVFRVKQVLDSATKQHLPSFGWTTVTLT